MILLILSFCVWGYSFAHTLQNVCHECWNRSVKDGLDPGVFEIMVCTEPFRIRYIWWWFLKIGTSQNSWFVFINDTLDHF